VHCGGIPAGEPLAAPDAAVTARGHAFDQALVGVLKDCLMQMGYTKRRATAAAMGEWVLESYAVSSTGFAECRMRCGTLCVTHLGPVALLWLSAHYFIPGDV
jgi:hypothetical protein